MRTSSSFKVFPDEASERDLARARWLRSEGRVDEAEAAYRNVMAHQRGLHESWTECFDLLRSAGKLNEALGLASEAAAIFTTEAFPYTLKAAALIEQDRFEEALGELQVAVERDPYLALTWHELGYAAYRLGNPERALLALDRAFALEPHTETLFLRGRIFRDAGEYYAAEVAFQAAAHSAVHDEQRAEAEDEVRMTHRLGAFAHRRLADLTAAESWFAKHGTVVLASADGDSPPANADLVTALVDLAVDREWKFGQLVTTDDDPIYRTLASQLAVPNVSPPAIDPEQNPLLISTRPQYNDPDWQVAAEQLRNNNHGIAATLWHPEDTPPKVDIVGGLEHDGRPLGLVPDPATALVMAQHPEARLAGRNLPAGPSSAAAT